MGAGRFIFGIGVGGEFPREYEACGVPLKQRGGRANEWIEIIKRLWTGEPVEYHGKYFSFGKNHDGRRSRALPGGPPVWVGGRAEGCAETSGAIGRRMDAVRRHAQAGRRKGSNSSRARLTSGGPQVRKFRHRATPVRHPRGELRSCARGRGDASEQALRDGFS